MDFIRDIEDVVDLRDHLNPLRHRNVRERNDPFAEFSDAEFRNRYRLTKEAVRFVTDLIEEQLQPRSLQEINISPALQVLTTLRFFAKGCYQIENADLHGISQPSVSRIVSRVSRAVATLLPRFVKWPQRIADLKERFYAKAGFPNVVGCIDCTHIRIKNPDGNNPLLYCNRKGFYSLNVQIVCDDASRILDVVARWRGSAHDARIWDNCGLKNEFVEGRRRGILLGDSGYPCTNYLLTPLLNPTTEAERAYNSSHKSTRAIIECCFGRWKGLFKALKNDMQISLRNSKTAIAAMAVLYNIKLSFDADWEYDDNENDEAINDVLEQNGLRNDQQEFVNRRPQVGNLFRRNFIQQNFA